MKNKQPVILMYDLLGLCVDLCCRPLNSIPQPENQLKSSCLLVVVVHSDFNAGSVHKILKFRRKIRESLNSRLKESQEDANDKPKRKNKLYTIKIYVPFVRLIGL